MTSSSTNKQVNNITSVLLTFYDYLLQQYVISNRMNVCVVKPYRRNNFVDFP